MDINEILNLINGERHGDENRYDSASETQTSCHNYSLAGTSTCTPDVSDLTLYIDVPGFEPTEYVKQTRSIDTGNGEETPVWTRTEPRVRFIIFGSQAMLNKLNRLALHETITFTNLSDSVSAVVRPGTMEVQATPQDDHYRIEVSMLFADAAIITTVCCGSYYENAPFDECDGDGETGDPAADPDCANYEVSITLTEGPPVELTATTDGGPGQVETFTWYLDGEEFGTGATIQITLPGVYRVVATQGNCSVMADYTYSGDCGGYSVTIQTIETEDGDFVLVATPNLPSTYQWQVFNDPNWEDIVGETSIVFLPDADGTYRVVTETTGGCEAMSDGVMVDLPTDCTDLFTITLVNNSGTLEVTINDYAGVGTPTYQWYADTGSGMQDTGNTMESVSGPAPGYWEVAVTLDGCTQSASILVPCDYEEVADDCGCGDSSQWYEEFTAAGAETSFAVTNFYLADPAHVSSVEIGATYLVQKNGVSLVFVSGTPAASTEWTINYGTQSVEIAAAHAAEAGDVYSIRKLRCVKL